MSGLIQNGSPGVLMKKTLLQTLKVLQVWLIVLNGSFGGLTGIGAAQPSMQAFSQGNWPNASVTSSVLDLQIIGNYAYLANGDLQVIDVSDPARCVRVGGYDASQFVSGVAVSGSFA